MRKTQGRTLIEQLKKRPHTYMEMLAYGVSVSPWKRIKESLIFTERLEKGQRRGLTTWRVVRG
jgi:hypothetical protein